MNQQYVVGVDLGGTKILTALANLQGEILGRILVDTGTNEPAERVIGRIVETIEQVIAGAGVTKDQVKRVGIGSPGSIKIKEGIVCFWPNLNWRDVPIVQIMEKALDLPVVLENDANAAALAEYKFGAGRGTRHMIYMTISTGIGGGIVIDGKLLHGADDSAGEIGHHSIMADGPLCGCKNRGCLEVLASGTALGRYGREAVESGVDTMMGAMVQSPAEVTGATVTRAAAEGDTVAVEIIQKVATYIGIGITNMINIFNPEKIVLGGGVMKAGHLFMEKIVETVQERALPGPRARCQIVVAELGQDVGVLGAIAVAVGE